MKVVFVLPGLSRVPVGGFKIIYEYANRLSNRGYNVEIIYYCKKTQKKVLFLGKILCILATKYYPKWFILDKNIKKICSFELEDRYTNKDVIIATSIATAEPVYKLSTGKKIYFIQDFENWGGYDKDYIYKTYSWEMKNIVISSWLKRIVDKYSKKPSILIRNGLDYEVFKLINPIEKRNRYSISMLYHEGVHKGSRYGIEVLKRLKKYYPLLDVTLFGVFNRPLDLPEWINYERKPTQKDLCKIYNETAIFLCTSLKEGFGLTGAESMACGCAYVSTDYGGQREYTIDNENVLLSPVKDVDSIENNIKILIENDKLRIKIAKNGYDYIREILNWNKSIDLLENTLKEE